MKKILTTAAVLFLPVISNPLLAQAHFTMSDASTIDTPHLSWNQNLFHESRAENVKNQVNPENQIKETDITTVVRNFPAISHLGSRTIIVFDHVSMDDFEMFATIKNEKSECTEVLTLDVHSVVCTFVK